MIALFRLLLVERDEPHATPALAGGGLVPFIRKEVLERRQQEIAKAAPAFFHVAQIPLFDQAREKFLCQILGLLHAVASATRVNVERIPVGAAELFEGVTGNDRFTQARRQHHTPVSAHEQPLGPQGTDLVFGVQHRKWNVPRPKAFAYEDLAAPGRRTFPVTFEPKFLIWG